MRKLQARQQTIISSPSGLDASQITMKNQAKAYKAPEPVTSGDLIPGTVETSFSRIGGRVSITEATQQNATPTDANCSEGYRGYVNGRNNADTAGNMLAAKVHCGVCSDPPSSEPYRVVLPCRPFIDPISYNPNATTVDPTTATPGSKPQAVPCKTSKDMGVLYKDNSELIANEARQLNIRKQYGLPNKLTGLRGPIVNRRI
jgi:hypothetical protein